MFDKFADIWEVLRSEGGLRTLAACKPRSISSFRLVQGLRDQQVSFSTIVDGGANVGQFARAASLAYPDSTILSFEPLPDVARKLRHNLADLPNHRVFEKALGNIDGEIEFHQSSYSQSSSVLVREKCEDSLLQGTREIGTLKVVICKLDSELDHSELRPPVLLKLDVQGYELEALQGAREVLARTSHVLVETAFEKTYAGEPHFEEVWLYLRERGFRFVRPLAFRKDRRGRIVQIDALFQQGQSSEEQRPSSTDLPELTGPPQRVL
ncbi:MAG: FkbM family methyltransferase [Planctomycetota bacterium]|nr:FkbM family methyltransferase [Planctomycetota bacterium]